jgi:hypothetical protein
MPTANGEEALLKKVLRMPACPVSTFHLQTSTFRRRFHVQVVTRRSLLAPPHGLLIKQARHVG